MTQAKYTLSKHPGKQLKFFKQVLNFETPVLVEVAKTQN